MARSLLSAGGEENIDRFQRASLQEPWILLFGGVTEPGNKRASRICATALDRGLDVVWCSGHESASDESHVSGPGPDVVVVEYGSRHGGSLWTRLALRGEAPSGSLRAALWRTIGRRLANLVRPYAGWRSLRRALRLLSKARPPEAIAYCDDTAVTPAWHAARIWPDSRLITDAAEL